MKRVILGGLAGGVVYYIWGMAAWMWLGLHANTFQPLPEDDVITAELKSLDLPTGAYSRPFPKDPKEFEDPKSDFFTDHLAGPIYTIYYHPEGGPPMEPKMFIGGFVLALLEATLAACLLSSALADCRSFARRVGFVIGLALFVALVGHAAYWNWMRFPTAYTVTFIVDVLIGWTLAGLAIAAIVKPGDAESKTAAEPVAATTPQPKSKTQEVERPPKSTRNDAITLLATLQREARFLDIVKEPLSDYSDAQVGAAARDVLRDCGAVLDRLFDLQPVVDQPEGENLDLPEGFDAGRYRITGNVSGEPPYSGPLVHHGWEAKKCSLPQWTGSPDATQIVAPAELEVK